MNNITFVPPVTLVVDCITCGKRHEIVVTLSSFYRFKVEGESINSCFNYLTDDEREMLISGLCNDCWDKMFGSEDDEEE